MDIFKIVGLGIISALLCVFMKNSRPEISVILSLAATIIILFYILPFFVANKDVSIPTDNANKIKQIEPAVEIVRSNMAAINLIPVKINTVAIPYFT